MKRFFSRPVALTGIALSLGGVAAALTITPARHEYPDTAVPGGLSGKTFVVGGIARGDSAFAMLTGPDRIHFRLEGAKCEPDRPCSFEVTFRPRSEGQKVATLLVSDYRSGSAAADLKGKGVAAPCLNKVVFCNYAHLYTGVIRWNSVLRGPNSSTTISVQVDVVKGVASCNGSETNFEAASGSKRGDITGTGLIAVEFDRERRQGKGFLEDDSTMGVIDNDTLARASPVYYNIRVACPTPSFGATDTDAAIPSQPAELGHYEQQSYSRPATFVGMELVGSTSYQDGAADPLNNVDGTVTMSWQLLRR